MIGEPWTEERLALVQKLWREGLSAKAIAIELGGVTRNAVIGKLHRLKLSRSDKPARTEAPPRAPRPPAHQEPSSPRLTARAPKPAPKRKPAKAAPPPVMVKPKPAPVTGPLTIFQLTDTTCKWALTVNLPHQFCGAGILVGTPYCQAHARLAYTNPLLRRAG